MWCAKSQAGWICVEIASNWKSKIAATGPMSPMYSKVTYYLSCDPCDSCPTSNVKHRRKGQVLHEFSRCVNNPPRLSLPGYRKNNDRSVGLTCFVILFSHCFQVSGSFESMDIGWVVKIALLNWSTNNQQGHTQTAKSHDILKSSTYSWHKNTCTSSPVPWSFRQPKIITNLKFVLLGISQIMNQHNSPI